jgi:RimJ/RimL family protein N-acetyltransferase
MTQFINDPQVTVHLKTFLPIPEGGEREYVSSLSKQNSKDIILAIVVDDTFIGTMGIHGINYRNGTATTGALIGKKEFWGKGYGSEAKMLLLEYAFNTLNLRKVYSNVFSFNERSINYSLRCGYKVEGRLKADHYAMGQYWDKVQLSVFREDFLPLWEAFAETHKDALMVPAYEKHAE